MSSVSTAANTAYTLFGQMASVGLNLADATTYYIGGAFNNSTNTTAAIRRIPILKAGTIVSCTITFTITGTLGTSETFSVSIRLNNTTDYLISSSVTMDANPTVFSNASMSVPVAVGDYIEFKMVTPTWVTNPTTALCYITALVQ